MIGFVSQDPGQDGVFHLVAVLCFSFFERWGGEREGPREWESHIRRKRAQANEVVSGFNYGKDAVHRRKVKFTGM